MPGTQGPTAHEKLAIHEALRMESAEVQKLQAMSPMMADADMSQLVSNCLNTAQTHVRALGDYLKSQQLVQ